MRYQYFLSLTLSSLLIQGFADSKKDSKESQKKEVNAQFVGVKRDATSSSKKKSKKAKNPWYTSKTHPRPSKKRNSNSDENLEPPADLPHLEKTSSLVASTSSLSPYLSQNEERSVPAERYEPSYPITGFEAPRGHIYLMGDWLFWRTCQEGMEFATTDTIDFEFQSGFRVGLGAHFPDFDGWEIDVDYTRFIPDQSTQVTALVYPQFLFQGAAVTSAFGKWKVSLQSLDVDLGKPYYLTETLVFNPWFGFKGVWLYQHAHFQYQGGYIPTGQIYSTYFKNNFKGAGPFIGTHINWQIGGGFGLFGTVGAALLAGHFNNRQVQKQFGGAQVVNFYKISKSVSPMLQLLAGIAWDRNFHRDRCHIGLRAGFESQYFWSQNQTELFTADVQPIYVRQKGDLAFYGLTLGGRFDF